MDGSEVLSKLHPLANGFRVEPHYEAVAISFGAVIGQRLRAARRHAVDWDAHLAGLVGQIVLDAGAREDHDADRHAVEHLIVALERCGLGVFGPVRLEGDLRHFAIGGPGGCDALSALG